MFWIRKHFESTNKTFADNSEIPFRNSFKNSFRIQSKIMKQHAKIENIS